VKKLIIFTSLLAFPIVIFSQTKIKSFYFDNNQSTPTSNSKKQLDLVKIEKSLDKKIKIEEKPLLILNNPIETALEDSLPFILNISFIEGTTKIESKSFVEIKKLADYLNSNQNTYTILIRGHVCCGKNMRISRNRAKAVYEELLKLGVEKSRLAYIGMSNKEPLVYPEKTNADRQKNRRVDIIFNTTSNQ
jgi:flagellar motor protein MotB